MKENARVLFLIDYPSFSFSVHQRTPGFFLIACIILISLTYPCLATEPAWTLSDGGSEIKDVAITTDGAYIVAGAGKILLISKDGVVQSRVPFGEIVALSSDGSVIASAYASTVYLFRKNTDSKGSLVLQKIWEATPQPEPVTSVLISDKGDKVVINNRGGGVVVLDGKTGNTLGSSTEYSSIIAMSARGSYITGISPGQGLMVYSPTAKTVKKYDLTLSGTPVDYLMTDDGKTGILSNGQNLEAIRANNGSLLWKSKTPGAVTAIAMTRAGNRIAAGTESGILGLYDGNGTQLWNYSATGSGTSGRQSIESIAMNPDGSKILAGSQGGEIFFLDGKGNPIWTAKVKGQIKKVTLAADGSLAVAAGDTSLYGFIPGSKAAATGIPTEHPTGINTPGTPTTDPAGVTLTIPVPIQSTSSVVTAPTPAPTEYSVIRTAAEKSPLTPPLPVLAASITFALVFLRRRRV